MTCELQEHPVSEALFNFVNAWSLMLWPLMVTDRKGEHVGNKGLWYIGTQVSIAANLIGWLWVAIAVCTGAGVLVCMARVFFWHVSVSSKRALAWYGQVID